MKTNNYTFAFQYNYDTENREFIYAMFGVDRQRRVKKVFLRKKKKIDEINLTQELVVKSKKISENYIKNK